MDVGAGSKIGLPSPLSRSGCPPAKAVHLAVEHVRPPRQRVPVALLGRRDRPREVVPHQAVLHVGVVIHISLIVEARELERDHRPVHRDGGGDKGQADKNGRPASPGAAGRGRCPGRCSGRFSEGSSENVMSPSSPTPPRPPQPSGFRRRRRPTPYGFRRRSSRDAAAAPSPKSAPAPSGFTRRRLPASPGRCLRPHHRAP